MRLTILLQGTTRSNIASHSSRGSVTHNITLTHHRTKFIYKEENLHVARLVGADFFAVSNQFSIPAHIQMASTNVFIILIVCLSISQVKCNFWVGHGKIS